MIGFGSPVPASHRVGMPDTPAFDLDCDHTPAGLCLREGATYAEQQREAERLRAELLPDQQAAMQAALEGNSRAWAEHVARGGD